MMHEGRGLVVDVSDFLRSEACWKWEDLKKGYYRLYRPFVLRFRVRIPRAVLDGVRVSYRLFRRLSPGHPCYRIARERDGESERGWHGRA